MKQLSNIKKEQGNLGRISMEKIKKKIDIKRITSALLGFPLVVFSQPEKKKSVDFCKVAETVAL